jgi:Rrf2 family protein
MLSITSQYALRALAYLAAQPADAMVRGQALSRETGIPKNYLSKVLLVLGNAGIVEAVRGNAGGYRLVSKNVPLVRVVELFERQIARRACLLGVRLLCSDEDPCTAHQAWRPAKTAYFDFLETTTLGDISAGPMASRSPTRRRPRPQA